MEISIIFWITLVGEVIEKNEFYGNHHTIVQQYQTGNIIFMATLIRDW